MRSVCILLVAFLVLGWAGLVNAQASGHLVVETEPGVTVFIDGANAGITEEAKPLVVVQPAGEYALRAEKDGFESVQIKVQVQADAASRVLLQMPSPITAAERDEGFRAQFQVDPSLEGYVVEVEDMYGRQFITDWSGPQIVAGPLQVIRLWDGRQHRPYVQLADMRKSTVVQVSDPDPATVEIVAPPGIKAAAEDIQLEGVVYSAAGVRLYPPLHWQVTRGDGNIVSHGSTAVLTVPRGGAVTVQAATGLLKSQTELDVSFSLSGQLLDAAGQPIAGANVVPTSFRGGVMPVITDEEGFWNIDGCIGMVRLAVAKPGYQFDPAVRFHSSAAENVGFIGTYSVSGRVLDPDGQGVAGAQIYLSHGEQTLVTNRDGAFSVSGLGGAVTVEAKKDGWQFVPTVRTVTGPESDVDFFSTFTVSGRVEDGAGRGIAGVEMRFDDGTQGVVTDEMGYWSQDEFSGPVRIQPVKPGYVFLSDTVSGPIHVEQVGGYRLGGRVTDAQERGIADVQISFGHGFPSVTTDGNGYWSQTNLSGSVTVQAAKEGYLLRPEGRQQEQGSNAVNFSAEYQVMELQLQAESDWLMLGDSLDLTVLAVDLYGQEVHATKSWRIADGQGELFTREDGTAVFTSTEPGSVTVAVTVGDRTTQLDLMVREVAELTITPGSIQLEYGGKQHFVVTAVDQFDQKLPLAPEWEVVTGDGSLSVESGAATTFAAVAPGLARLQVQVHTSTAVAEISVLEQRTLAAIVLTASAEQIKVGQWVEITAVGFDQYQDRMAIDGQWQLVSGPGRLQTTLQGYRYTADQEGTGIIRFTAAGISEQITIQVDPLRPTRIELSRDQLRIGYQTWGSITAVVYDQDGDKMEADLAAEVVRGRADIRLDGSTIQIRPRSFAGGTVRIRAGSLQQDVVYDSYPPSKRWAGLSVGGAYVVQQAGDESAVFDWQGLLRLQTVGTTGWGLSAGVGYGANSWLAQAGISRANERFSWTVLASVSQIATDDRLVAIALSPSVLLLPSMGLEAIIGVGTELESGETGVLAGLGLRLLF